MSEPDYFKMAVDINNLYIAGVKRGYSQGKIDGFEEAKKRALDILGDKGDK